MPIRIPLCQIGVSRNGLTVYPKIGEQYNFTIEEVKEINELQVRTGKKFFDKIVEAEPEPEVKPKPEAVVASAKPTAPSKKPLEDL